MRQDRTATPAAKENPATVAAVTGSKTANPHGSVSLSMRLPVRTMPAYSGRGAEFARLMRSAR